MYNVFIFSIYNIGCLFFDEFDRFESFVYVVYGQVVVEVKYGVFGIFVVVFQFYKVFYCFFGYYFGGYGFWAGIIFLFVVIIRVFGLLSIIWECNLYDYEALFYCII